MKAKQIILSSRPDGSPITSDFTVDEINLPSPNDGEVIVRNLWLSVDPYMRLSMSGPEGLHAVQSIGTVPAGSAVGEIVESKSEKLPVGSIVVSPAMGWREAYVAPDDTLNVVNDNAGPVQRFLGIYGLTGITAYGGTKHVLDPQRGETIFVSGAAGAVGSVVVQLAKLSGATVIASAGSAGKGKWLTETLGVDHFINYKSDDIAQKLAEFAPDGIEMFFDNVGGKQLEIAISAMKPRGRIALCGAIAQYDTDNYRSGPGNMFAIIEKHVSMTGFNAGFYYDRAPEIIGEYARLIKNGDLIWEETVVEGIENVPQAFVDMLSGANTGKMLIKLGD